MALDLSTLTAEQQLAAIYIGYYDRAADPVGQDFWEGAVANPNLSLADIATDFATQPETLIAYPFLDNPTAEEAEGFIAEVYLNLFNRAPDAAGLAFWSDALLAAIDGTGELSVGEIILAIIGGAQNSEAGQDLTTILNKIEVSTSWTAAADAAEIDYATDSAAQNSAKSIIEGVTESAASVTAAKSTIDNFFVPAPVPGESFFLTSATDAGPDFTGTADDDEFLAYIQQNPFAGGVSNSLSSADRLDGGAGNDRLYAEVIGEFIGVTGTLSGDIDIQPRIKNIEELDFEAREGVDDGFAPTGSNGEDTDIDVTIDAKHITDHEEIGSYYSDGDLKIENLTTLTSGGAARNTSEITVTMDHTDNFNSDEDASDLVVLFDNDYLLSGQEAAGQIFYFLLDEDAELAGNPNRLNNIDVDGIRFTIDTGNGPVEVNIEAPEANVAGTHQGFVNALQAPLQALIADGTLPAGTTLTLDPTITDTTFLDNGAESDLIPAIVLTSGDGSEVIATGFSRIEEEIGEYDVYGRFNSVNEVADQPISIDIDLHKAGRGGEGGDLIVGGKDTETAVGIADGIEVFNINVLGAGNDDPNGGMTKPSNVGTIASTGNELRQVYIATDPVFAAGDTYASLTVRNGFDENRYADTESGDLQLINADAFLGDLTLGTAAFATSSAPSTWAGRITNADTITAQGGGDVAMSLRYDGNEVNQAYTVTTGGGSDDIDVLIDGDALDFAGSSLNVSTGGGNDDVVVDFAFDAEDNSNQQLNQAILDNVNIETGSGDDMVDVDGVGNANIETGSGNDTIFTDGGAATAKWAFNFDNARVDAQGGFGGITDGNLPGVQTSLAYIGGATVTVTLSGAGISGNYAAGGGVMAEGALGAVAGDDGYEATATISSLLNGNQYFGDQRDVNAAIMEAINTDPVLSQLLTVTMGSNNTLLIASTTSGAFDATDLRIDIDPVAATSLTYAQAVASEAQSVFGDSDNTVARLFGTDVAGNFTADTPVEYQFGAADVPGADLSDNTGANAWFDGLSVETATNSADDNLKVSGSVDGTESDNVIDGGADDDLIVLSTDAVENLPTAFTDGGNNALINGASNETIVLTGSNFGNDTVMNFQVGDYTVNPAVTTTTLTATVADTSAFDTAGTPPEGGAVSVTVGTNTFTTAVGGTGTAADIAAALAASMTAATGVTFSANGSTVTGSTTGTFPTFTASLGIDNDTTTDSGNELGTADTTPIPDNDFGDETVALTFTPSSSTAPQSLDNAGLDFLDFSAYLTSEENTSSGTGSDSDSLIDVTLGLDVTDVQANEVSVVTFTNGTGADAGETFAGLSASIVAQLFNNGSGFTGFGGNATFGSLSAATTNADDEYGDGLPATDELIGGAAKSILMVENAANDGEYKVFELSWNGDASADTDTTLDGVVSANLLGTLDFGDSLVNGVTPYDLDAVNLVGSDAYNTLIAEGFYNFVA